MYKISFPVALTEEEEILKQTFARLKKKKKMLQALKSGTLNQEKEIIHSKSITKQSVPLSVDQTSKAKATEQAKKLVQSGAIKLTGVKEKSGFKRSKTLERKQESDKPAVGMGFTPFSSFNSEEEDDRQPPNKRMKVGVKGLGVKGLGESFVSAGYGNRDRTFDRPEREFRDREPRDFRDRGGDRPDRGDGDRPDRSDRPDRGDRREFREREPREPPKKGNTVFVHGVGVTEEMMQKAFASFGKIINVNVEKERNKAFITFEKTESADQAINEVNGSMVHNIQLRVQMARNQPSFDALGDASSTASWASIAASNSQKATSHRDRRGVVQYDQDDMF